VDESRSEKFIFFFSSGFLPTLVLAFPFFSLLIHAFCSLYYAGPTASFIVFPPFSLLLVTLIDVSKLLDSRSTVMSHDLSRLTSRAPRKSHESDMKNVAGK